jgi:hypothetical protein
MDSASDSVNSPKLAGYRTRTAEQMHRDGVKGGTTTFERGAGIFAISPEQHSANSRKGGSIGGKVGIVLVPREAKARGGQTQGTKNRKEGTGIFGMTPEQKSRASKKGSAAMPHEAKVLGGITTCHLRHHVARGRVSPKCILCTGE